MLKLSPVEALDYAAALEDAAEELHILGRLVPPHYQYSETAEEVRFSTFPLSMVNLFLLDRSKPSGTGSQRSTQD